MKKDSNSKFYSKNKYLNSVIRSFALFDGNLETPLLLLSNMTAVLMLKSLAFYFSPRRFVYY
jgi:hypothetical protein